MRETSVNRMKRINRTIEFFETMIKIFEQHESKNSDE